MNTMFGVFMFLCTPGTLSAPGGWLLVDFEPWPIIYQVGYAQCRGEV